MVSVNACQLEFRFLILSHQNGPETGCRHRHPRKIGFSDSISSVGKYVS